jgi:checkpoint serine/threonine-protein kinase
VPWFLTSKFNFSFSFSFFFFLLYILFIYLFSFFFLLQFVHAELQDTINGYKISNEPVDKKMMPECLVMYYTIEMLKIVEAMHECGIIHGDLKPDNFMLR